MKLLTGSKYLLSNVVDYLLRLFNDQSTKPFGLNFLTNFLLKPSTTVIKRLIEDKSFLSRSVFDSEVDASIYPLPSMLYSLTEGLLVT